MRANAEFAAIVKKKNVFLKLIWKGRIQCFLKKQKLFFFEKKTKTN